MTNLALTKKLTDKLCLFFTDMTYMCQGNSSHIFFSPKKSLWARFLIDRLMDLIQIL